ncbi:MAG TPA: M90 family metallopeptidase [Gammaproteobacteria bacterium]|nr:M90 family metallopeptidase [Gammaproteobacteria bacterium]
MVRYFKAWRERRILARHPVSEDDWRRALAACAPARRLDASAQARLRVLVTLFLYEKSVEPVQGLGLSGADRVLLATHACLPILNLGMGWYRDWHAVIVYPDLFIPQRPQVDHAGVVHHRRQALAGEAWSQGPVILSWQEVVSAGQPSGHNVTIHEMTHKLDMLNGEANGYPPLHANMNQSDWSRAFTGAWQAMQARWQNGEPLPMDAYGLTSPGEFLAVVSELFFEQPAQLHQELPELYRQLALFYRQRPLSLD